MIEQPTDGLLTGRKIQLLIAVAVETKTSSARDTYSKRAKSFRRIFRHAIVYIATCMIFDIVIRD